MPLIPKPFFVSKDHSAGNHSNTAADPDNAPAEDGDYTYSYDYENRLVQVAFFGTTARYSYDALGRRIEKNVNGAITQYLYDGANIVTEYDGGGNVKAKDTHNLAVDAPLAVQQGGSTFYYHKDGLGSVTDLTDLTELTVYLITTVFVIKSASQFIKNNLMNFQYYIPGQFFILPPFRGIRLIRRPHDSNVAASNIVSEDHFSSSHMIWRSDNNNTATV